MSFLAWRKADAVGRCLDGALAALAAIASQALHVRRPRRAGPQLDALLAEVRAQFPPVSPRAGRSGATARR